MPQLPNHRHELFAQALAAGKTAIQAYIDAGYTPNDGNCIRLKDNERVKARIEEILGKAAEKVIISRAKVLAELARIGFANMNNYVTVDSEGLAFVDLSNVTSDQMAAIQEVTVETRMETGTNEAGEKEAVPVRKVRFRLMDKRAALVDIAKIEGWAIERHEIGLPGAFDGKSDAELLEEFQREAGLLGLAGSETEH